MDFAQWCDLVRVGGQNPDKIDLKWLYSEFNQGTSPAITAVKIKNGNAPARPLPPQSPPQPIDTGMGACVQCGSRHIIQTKETSGDSSQKSTAALLGCLCFFPLLFLIPFVGNKRHVSTSRHCKQCGHRWPV